MLCIFICIGVYIYIYTHNCNTYIHIYIYIYICKLQETAAVSRSTTNAPDCGSLRIASPDLSIKCGTVLRVSLAVDKHSSYHLMCFLSFRMCPI